MVESLILSHGFINHQSIMKSIKYICLGIAIAFISISACKKNEPSDAKHTSSYSPQFLTDYLGEEVTKDVSGTVLDANENPVLNAAISVGNKSTTTDSLGNFKLSDATVHSNFILVEAKKEDYKSTFLSVEPNDTVAAKITLHKAGDPCLFWFCKSNHALPN